MQWKGSSLTVKFQSGVRFLFASGWRASLAALLVTAISVTENSAQAQFISPYGDCVMCNSLGLQGGAGTPASGALASSLADFGRALPHTGLILGQQPVQPALPMLPIASTLAPYNGMPLHGGMFGTQSRLWIPGNPMPGSLEARPSVLAERFPNRFETPYYSAASGVIPGGEFAPWKALDAFPVNPAVPIHTLPRSP